MTDLLARVCRQSQALANFLEPLRAQARQSLAQAQWPTRKTEAWRYTPLRALTRQDWQSPIDAALPHWEALPVASLDFVFVDGQLVSRPETLPKGLVAAPFSELTDQQQAQLLQRLNQVKPERHLFGQINDALLVDGLWLDVAAGAQIAEPIRVLHLGQSEQAQVNSRLLLSLGAQAQAHLIEEYQGTVSQWHNSFVEIILAENASLQHQGLYLQSQASLLLAGWHASLGKAAELNSLTIALGSELKRLDVDLVHADQHAHARMDHLYLLRQQDLFDLHSCVEHAQPNGKTDQRVRGLIADRARAVFNGRIHIHQDAQKTAATLNTRSLLLSDQAEVDAKPELEIYADDVTCAHGATISQMDRQALFYLQSRGLSHNQAQSMLSLGFLQELLDPVAQPALRDHLRQLLVKAFDGLHEEAS